MELTSEKKAGKHEISGIFLPLANYKISSLIVGLKIDMKKIESIMFLDKETMTQHSALHIHSHLAI